MFRERIKNSLNWGITIFLVIACSILFYFLLENLTEINNVIKKVLGVLAPVTWGLVITFLLNPLMQRIERLLAKIPAKFIRSEKTRRRVSRTVGIVLSEIFLLAILIFLLRILLPQLIDSVRMLVTNIGDYVNGLETWLTPYLAKTNDAVRAYVDSAIEQVRGWITGFVQNDFMKLVGNLTNGVVLVGRTLYNFILGVVVSIYLLASKERMIALAKKCVCALFKPERANRIFSITREANDMFRGFIVGKILDSAIIGVLCFLGMTILQLPFVLLVSVIVGITNVIPYFGPIIGAVPSVFLILMIDPIKSLVFLIFVIILQQLDGNLIGPRILGDKTGVSSFGVLFSILVGGGLFGFIGMLVAVPTFGLIFRLCKRFVEKKLANRNMPLATNAYTNLDYVAVGEDGKTSLAPMKPDAPKQKKKKNEK